MKGLQDVGAPVIMWSIETCMQSSTPRVDLFAAPY